MSFHRLQATQVDLIEYSFDQIKSHRLGFAADFYTNLFTDYPQIKPFFTQSDISVQYDKLMNALILVRQNLRTPDTLFASLKGLGVKHLEYGVSPEHYQMFGKTLLKTLADYLDTKWTPEIQKSWVDAYTMIVRVMLAGAEYPQYIFQISPWETLSCHPYGRPLVEILEDLNKPIPEEMAKLAQSTGFDVNFIAWQIVAKLLNHFATGWEGFVTNSQVMGDFTVVTYRITIHAAEGSFSRESLGSSVIKAVEYEQSIAEAEAKAFINTAAKWGLKL
jgi:hemoglobin-like flavoprotein